MPPNRTSAPSSRASPRRAATTSWCAGAAWSAAAALFAGLLCGLAFAVAAAVALSPLVLIAALVGPDSGGSALDRWLLYAAAGMALVPCSAYGAYRALVGAVGWGRAQSDRTIRYVWSALGCGALGGLALAQQLSGVGLKHMFPPRVQDASDLARSQPLPFTEASAAELQNRWLPAAQLGDAHAQFELAEAYRNGLMGMAPNTTVARKWLDKSVAQGDPDALLSLLVAQRLGYYDMSQHLNNQADFEAYAKAHPGPRAAAVYLMISETLSGKYVNDFAAREAQRGWRLLAAQAGSRYAAFRLGRDFELLRDAQGAPAANIREALRWFAAAGASFEVERLQHTHGIDGAPASVQPVPSWNVDEAARFKLRSQLVDQRTQALSVVNMTTIDALAHRTLYADVALEPRFAGDFFAERVGGARFGRDDAAARVYFERGARQGDADSMMKLADSALLDGAAPWQLSFAYRWYALAAETIANTADAAQATRLTDATAARDRTRDVLSPDAQKTAAQALDALRASLRARLPS